MNSEPWLYANNLRYWPSGGVIAEFEIAYITMQQYAGSFKINFIKKSCHLFQGSVGRKRGVCGASGPWTPGARRACIRSGPFGQNTRRGLRTQYTLYNRALRAQIGRLQKILYPPTYPQTQRFWAALWIFDDMAGRGGPSKTIDKEQERLWKVSTLGLGVHELLIWTTWTHKQKSTSDFSFLAMRLGRRPKNKSQISKLA